ncbi:hypothetical protein [Ferrovibrio sp.]|uniref:hypothetical protein n=1 Tax=Ferrovibrio sp. TaxID=1917215 RepID=UPI0035B2F909
MFFSGQSPLNGFYEVELRELIGVQHRSAIYITRQIRQGQEYRGATTGDNPALSGSTGSVRRRTGRLVTEARNIGYSGVLRGTANPRDTSGRSSFCKRETSSCDNHAKRVDIAAFPSLPSIQQMVKTAKIFKRMNQN